MTQSEELEELEALAEAGDIEAQTKLVAKYYTGVGVAKDAAKFLYWLSKAAEAGEPSSQCVMGCIVKDGALGLEKNVDKAIDWWRKSSAQGDEDAQHNMGNAYLHGTGVEKDVRQAAQYYKAAALQGLPESQYALARIYALGLLDGSADDKASLEWLIKAAKQGYEPAIKVVDAHLKNKKAKHIVIH